MAFSIASCSDDIRVAFCIPWPDLFGGPALAIRWYAIMILLGIIVGTAFAVLHAGREGEEPGAVLNAMITIIPAAFLGARLMFVVVETLSGDGRYLANPLLFFDFRAGGSNWFGVLLAGSAIVLYLAHRGGFDLWLAADCGALGLWVGQGVGRFCNLLNYEAYGPPTGLSWFGLVIPERFRYPQYSDMAIYPPTTLFHGTMLYESIWLLVSFVAVYNLLMRFHDRYRVGSVVGLYFVVAGIGRFIAENWRPDQARLAATDVSFARILALLEVLIGIALIIYRLSRQRVIMKRGAKSKEENAIRIGES